MRNIWGQSDDKVIEVPVNNLGQPNEKKPASTLGSFLGTIARNGKYVPLDIKDWRKIPDSYKDDIITIVKSRFKIQLGDESFILKSIAKKRRSWKNRVKKSYFQPALSHDAQLQVIPDRVQEDQYSDLTTYWESEEVKNVSSQNNNNRTHQQMVHCMGKTSFAVIREILKSTLGREPT